MPDALQIIDEEHTGTGRTDVLVHLRHIGQVFGQYVPVHIGLFQAVRLIHKNHIQAVLRHLRRNKEVPRPASAIPACYLPKDVQRDDRLPGPRSASDNNHRFLTDLPALPDLSPDQVLCHQLLVEQCILFPVLNNIPDIVQKLWQ